jgi:hypothetical protein
LPDLQVSTLPINRTALVIGGGNGLAPMAMATDMKLKVFESFSSRMS